ncbi:glycoside hydrolase family 9 protein [Algoriphagus halophytocola]|uniref:Endoglucanase n=1 Tax=Algoriphagus halophytocola TaxID=2991499 RepID=A0ABY6MKW6_9BACT|nr:MULTISPECIES: glycoside hydrolase family 9 protein [unclassified Algoriphagus]UZD23818.1 glycoside hydrolase family 9 protein [Algoriphagus sp. TR-M5]WBL41185.1 glycoside hydrolase family 9 protein [Algoriphagus sp. TR-M9]
MNLTLLGFVLVILIGCKGQMVDDNLKVTETIRLNQVGFYPDEQKLAVLLDNEQAKGFYLLDHHTKEIVYEGPISSKTSPTLSGIPSRIADFSDFRQVGEFELIINGLGKSFPFQIQEEVYAELGRASLKAFYFQRASTSLQEKEAGAWARQMGHPDDEVRIHASAVSENRPEGTVLASPYGWYDAGDYNKYVVNSGITVGTLLSLYEDFPAYFQSLNLNIPESSNPNPDLLDEIRWNLDWMLSMQDPDDGGVYHKLTTANFEGMVAPHEATNPRYLVAKGTAATLDFAAVMAQAARVYKVYHPEESVRYLKAAEKAWTWAKKNPEVLYQQNLMNQSYDPDITTGAYGDRNLQDEWVWAAAELFISTHNLAYWEQLENANQHFVLPSWSQVSWMGYYSILRHQEDLELISPEWVSTLKANLLAEARTHLDHAEQSAYHTPMGGNIKDFVWGSNAVASNQGILLLYAYQYSGEKAFLAAALDNLDYILGRNAVNYCYVTGFGSQSPQHPHHRLAASRPDLPPLPGFMVGGANPGQQDGCEYPSKIADESYSDVTCSYASNEIAINWSAPFAYLVNAVEALEGK